MNREDYIQVFREKDREALASVQSSNSVQTIDTVAQQLVELAKIRMSGPVDASGISTVWVYFPWRKELVRLVEKELFYELRTSRNKYKITPEEQARLSACKVGVIGLSVGAAVAHALATERVGGELRIADFDTLDLSNLNRIQSSVADLGKPKTDLVYRRLVEQDPFLDIICFNEGITDDNIDAFLLDGGKLDLLFEECDNIELKIKIRKRCKALGIPVIMETSDRGMLDVERFDLDPEYPILHGLIDIEQLDQMTDPAQRRGYLVQHILQVQHISERGKMSLAEVGKTITTWPQLGTDVIAGGGIAAGAGRELLLGKFNTSGRWYLEPLSKLSETPFLTGNLTNSFQ
jgi:molybdopterin/thiamine biosynthesis adenylyltransferase